MNDNFLSWTTFAVRVEPPRQYIVLRGYQCSTTPNAWMPSPEELDENYSGPPDYVVAHESMEYWLERQIDRA